MFVFFNILRPKNSIPMKIKLLSVLGVALLLMSCGKKDNEEIIIDPPMADQRMFATAITWAVSDSYMMEYNSDKTLKRWVVGTPGSNGYDINLKYENGRVVKMTDAIHTQYPLAGDVIYGANGLPFKICESGDWRNYDSLEYNDKKQLITSYSMSTDQPGLIYLRYKLTWEGNNVTRLDYTLMIPNITSSTIYTYDDKKNYYTGCEAMGLRFILDPYYMSAGNVIAEKDLNDKGVVTAEIKYTYEYNEKGYPVKAWRAFNYTGESDVATDSARITYLQP